MSHVTSRCLEQFGCFACGLNPYEILILKEAYHKKSLKVFGSYETIWRDSFDAQSYLWISIKCMENIIMDKSSMMKGVDDKDDDDHEYHYCHYYYHRHHHHHHPHPHYYLHISSIGYLYVILTLHLNQNHLGTSGPNLVSLREDHLSDWLMKDFIF